MYRDYRGCELNHQSTRHLGLALHHPWLPAQKYDFIELFAGQAWVSRCVKHRGYSVAALDIAYGEPLEGKQDAMNLLSDAGFA